MQLTRFSDYTLRVLIAVGLSDEQGTTIGEIADQYRISRNHLMKVVHHLSHAGYLQTTRGKGGGLRLAKPADEIRLGDVLRYTEGVFALVPCFDAAVEPRCAIEPACVLKRVLGAGLAAFLDVLDRHTVADLLEPRQRLKRLLSGEAA